MSNPSKSINIIGAGKLGHALATDIHNHHLGTLVGICNKTLESSEKVASHFKTALPFSSIPSLPTADFIFITTPDDLISSCAEQLTYHPLLKPGCIIAHCSGVLSSDILALLENKGCHIASLHPMRSFSKAQGSTFKGAYCALEGSKEAVTALKALLHPLALNYLDISSQYKANYHCGGVFSANYLIAILHQAQKAYQTAGIEETLALNVACDLAQSVLTNIKKTQSLKKSLTGPLARGDEKTLFLHMNSLPSDAKTLYKKLALELLSLCDLPLEKKAHINTLLCSDETA